jgi:UDP-glucose 4-epimerase
VWHHVYGLNTTSIRYFNVYGPRQRDSPYSGVIAIWLGRIIRNEDLIIYGDGEQSRDFTYVEDVIQGNLLITEHNIPGEIINIACGNPIKLTDLAKLMLKLTGKENLGIKYTDPRPGDIKHSFGDISKAKKLLGFKALYTQEEGLRDYLKWYVNKYNIDLKIN